jgi:hypothetical protein
MIPRAIAATSGSLGNRRLTCGERRRRGDGRLGGESVGVELVPE